MSTPRDPYDIRDDGSEPALGKRNPLESSPAPDSLDERLPPIHTDPQMRGPFRNGAQLASGHPARRWPWVVLIILVILLAAVWLNQDRLRSMVPRTELNEVLSRADLALQDGRLDGQNGISARELFEAALSLQPDNDHAREGLRQVGTAELAQAATLFRAGQLAAATEALDQARELLGGGIEVDRLTQQIARARGTAVPADTLIEHAQRALAAGKLDGADGAGALYKRVLATEPGNAVAAHGLDKVGAELAAQIRGQLATRDAAGAAASIELLATLLPDYGDLPALRAAVAGDQRQSGGALATALQHGQDALRAGHISGAGDDTALAFFQQARALDPDNAAARAGLGQVAQALITQANAALDAHDRAQAAQLLDQAATLAPRSADLAAAQGLLGKRRAPTDTHTASAPAAATRVVWARRAATHAPAAQADPEPAPADVSPMQAAQAQGLVQRAQAAAARGQIMLPPGESAYDLFRNALALDGTSEAARDGLRDLPNQVSRQLNQALAGGQLPRADRMLADLADLAPGDAGQEVMRQRVVDAWLDQADRQLTHGDRAGAAASAIAARKVAAGAPSARLLELEARLQSGR